MELHKDTPTGNDKSDIHCHSKTCFMPSTGLPLCMEHLKNPAKWVQLHLRVIAPWQMLGRESEPHTVGLQSAPPACGTLAVTVGMFRLDMHVPPARACYEKWYPLHKVFAELA